MNRRHVIHTFLSLPVAGLFALPLGADDIHNTPFVNIDEDFIVQDRRIIYVGPTDRSYSLLEFHRHMSDLLDRAMAEGSSEISIVDPPVSLRYTDNIIEITDAYEIDETIMSHLHGGTLIHREEHYIMGRLAFGSIEDIDKWFTQNDGYQLSPPNVTNPMR